MYRKFTTPKIVTTITRTSTAEGYGYITNCDLVTIHEEHLLIKSQTLECRFGSKAFSFYYTREIKSETLSALQKFAGFSSRKVTKEISFKREMEIMKKLGAIK